jgi:hypothetical protein
MNRGTKAVSGLATLIRSFCEKATSPRAARYQVKVSRPAIPIRRIRFRFEKNVTHFDELTLLQAVCSRRERKQPRNEQTASKKSHAGMVTRRRGRLQMA